MEFVPSKLEKRVSMISISFSRNIRSIASITILDLVEDTSVSVIKSILNSLSDSSKLSIKIPNISFRAAEVDSLAKITMSVLCFMRFMFYVSTLLFLSNTFE